MFESLEVIICVAGLAAAWLAGYSLGKMQGYSNGANDCLEYIEANKENGKNESK